MVTVKYSDLLSHWERTCSTVFAENSDDKKTRSENVKESVSDQSGVIVFFLVLFFTINTETPAYTDLRGQIIWHISLLSRTEQTKLFTAGRSMIPPVIGSHATYL